MRTVTTGEFEGGSVFIDGDWRPLSEGKISLFDWGFTRSDATYDVASVWRGAFFRLDDHLDRFFASLAKLRMTIPHSRAEVRELLIGCVRAGGLRDAYVAMVCTRGVPPPGWRDPRLATNRFYAYALPFASHPKRSIRRSRTTTGSISCSRALTPTAAAPTPAASSMRTAMSPRA